MIKDAFDNQPVHKGVPYNYRAFGHEARGKGVMADTEVSGNQCVYFEVDFDADTWGALLTP